MIVENWKFALKWKGSEKRNPEEPASAILTIVQSMEESEEVDSYVGPLIKTINDLLKDVDEEL